MKENDLTYLIQGGWRSLILHPFFYNGIASSILLIEASSMGLLNYSTPFSVFNLINIFGAFVAITGILLSYLNRHKAIVLYSTLSLAVVLPTINILFDGADLRLSIFALPIAYLLELGVVCHALGSKTHGSYNAFVLIGLMLPMTRPDIVIEAESVGIQIILVIIILFTAFLFLILYSWYKMKSFLLINEKQLIDKIGSVIDIFSKILIKDDDIHKVLTNVAHKIIPSLEFEDCVIYLIDEERKVLIQEAAFGSKNSPQTNEIIDPLEIPLGKGIVGSVAASGIPEIISDTSKDKRYIQDGVMGYSELCVPIIINNKVIGVIDSEHSSKKFFNEVHLYFLQIIAAQCASKITEIRHEAIHQQSVELEMESKQLQETNVIKSRFISNLSHDLKTPLTLILGPSKELTKLNLTREGMDLVKLINSNGLQLKQIIDELLALNEMNFLSQNSNVTRVQFGSLITKWAEKLTYKCKQKNISFAINGSDELEIDTDEKKLVALIFGLFENAVVATPSNGQISITYGVQDQFFNLTIEDSRYYESSLDSMQETIQQELSIMQQLINSLNGKLTVRKSKFDGILLELILNVAEEKVLTENEENFFQEIKLNEISEKPIVLLIEDHDDLRQFVQQSLEEEFICVSCDTGEKGIELAGKLIPDIIITDLMLPGISGEEVCSIIRKDEQINHIPIIVSSAKSMTLDRVSLYKLGAENYITKPFEIEELVVIIRNTLQQRINLKLAFQDDFISGKKEEIRDPFIQKVIEIIELNISDASFNIGRLINELKIGRNQFQRKIKMLTNMTPVKFMQSIRLKKAHELLLQRELSISEIAYAVGFNNLSYFTRSFKRTFGQLPSEILETKNQNV